MVVIEELLREDGVHLALLEGLVLHVLNAVVLGQFLGHSDHGQEGKQAEQPVGLAASQLILQVLVRGNILEAGVLQSILEGRIVHLD